MMQLLQSQAPPGAQQQQQQPFVIPPQMLANLTPQQLQQMKNHPQFQEIMRQYMQRQQMQAMQRQQNFATGQPGLAPLSQVAAQQRYPQTTAGRQQSFTGGQVPYPNIPPQQQSYNPLQQVPPLTQAGAHQSLQQPYGNPQQQHQQQPGMIQQMTPQALQQFSRHQSQQDPAVAGQNQHLHHGPNPAVRGGGHIGGRSEIKDATPQIPPEVLEKVPISQLSSLDQWSKKLSQDGKLVPLDLKLYESIIQNDSRFITGYNKQLRNNKSLLEGMSKDALAYNQIKQLRMQAISLSNQGKFNNSIWGEGFQGYGNGITNGQTKLILPGKDFTERQINERVLKYIKEPSSFIPIRLDFDQEKDRFKLRDTFLWDSNEEILTVETFVHQLLEDYKLIHRSHLDLIVQTIKEQINEYQKRPKKTVGELRIPIKIDITINNTQLNDQFEWDILNFEDNDPEEFATVMCDELSLPGEFATAIAHLIREQTQMYYKALSLTGYSFDGAPIQEDEIRSHILPSIRMGVDDNNDDILTILRNPTTVADYSPSLIKLSQLEVERFDKEIERDSRRKRRHNATEELQLSSRGTSSRRLAAFYAGRGGPTIPDLSDLPKTFRTPAPLSILPGAVDLTVPAIYDYSEVFVNKTQVRNPDYKPPPPPNYNNHRVKYYHDPTKGSFTVVIKMP